MTEKMLFLFTIFLLKIAIIAPYTAVPPNWLTSPYFRAGNNKVINKNTGSNVNPTYTFTFSSALTGIPNLAYGIKSFRGIDQLRETNFEITRIGLTASTFSVSIQLYGKSNIFLLEVSYIAIDPTFPHHLNSFDNVPIEYNSTLTNITTSSASLTTFTKQIDYTVQSAANVYKTFTIPLNANKIVLFITSLCVVANTSAPFRMDISYSIINSTHYSWTANVFHYSTVTNLHFSQIIYNEDDVQASKLYMIVNTYWVVTTASSYQAFPIQLVDNMILGLTDLGAPNGACGLDYIWDFYANITGIPFAININSSMPAPNSTAKCGLNYMRSTLFYIKTWECYVPYIYYNMTAEKCQDACASYYYFNTTEISCTPCYYACYNCTLPASSTSCSQCQTGLHRYLVNNTCLCSDGYFQDGFQPACQACSAVDPYSLTCAYYIDPGLPTTFYQNIFNQTTWPTDILPNFTSISCVIGYFVNSSGLCQPCSTYCLTCIDASTCTLCNSSVPATLYTDNLCYLCNLSNCNSCYPDNVCVSCISPFVLQAGVCITCVQACQCDGWVLPKVNGTCSTLCGDGIMVGLQECDDGNTNDHDGCSSSCTLEPCDVSCLCDGWQAPWVVGNNSCTSICGDGLLRGNQECDDGNLVDEDGCSSTCHIEGCDVSCLCDGWILPKVSGMCTTVCGDGLLRGLEQCDDGNTDDHDGCSSTCQLQPCNVSCLCEGWIAPWTNNTCLTLCGDGFMVGLQECDDGNLNDHDGCSSVCTLQPCNVSCLCDGWTQPWIAQNNTCSPLCGDGILKFNEECDDGNLNDRDGCDHTCHIENFRLLITEMSQYPALALFALGFRIVGLQALHVFQSLQLILDSANIHTFQLSFNIHGYSDSRNFPLPVASEQHITMNFNFMYLILVVIFVIGTILQLYYLYCYKSNKILDTNDSDISQQDDNRSGTEDMKSEQHSCSNDFTVHYKSETKQKDEVTVNPLDESQILRQKQFDNFWGSIVFRQFFFDLLVNLLSIFVYSMVNQIKEVTFQSLMKIETLIIVVSMVFLLALILVVCSVGVHSFGQNHLKFHQNRPFQYWILIIGQKIVFSAILGSKQFWNLQVILVIKFFLLCYYFCANLYFEPIQKIRSVFTHLLHLLLIFAVILNEHILKKFGLQPSFPILFMEYIYAALLGLVLLLCIAFYIREIMHQCQADFRHNEEQKVFEISNGTISAVFDMKNGGDTMQESAQQFTMKGSNIFDDIKFKPFNRSDSNIDSSSEAGLNGGGAMAKKIVTINQISNPNSPSAAAVSLNNLVSMTSKKNARSQPGSNMMNVLEKQEEDNVQEFEENPKFEFKQEQKREQQQFSKSLYKPDDIKINFDQQKFSPKNFESQPYAKESKGFKKRARRVALKNKIKQAQNENVFKSDDSLIANEAQNLGVQKSDIFNKNTLSERKKQNLRITFHKEEKKVINRSFLSLGHGNQKGPKNGYESEHINVNYKETPEDIDDLSIEFE